MQKSQTPQASCPHLGLRNDQSTYSNFPSVNNVCFHVQPIASPASSHQYDYCLKKNHTKCRVYSSPAGNPLPSDLQHQAEKKPKNRMYFIVASCLIVIFAILLGVFWDEIKPTTETGKISPTTTQTINAIGLTVTNTSTRTPKEATNTATQERTIVTPSLTQSPSLTSSPSPSPKPTQGTLFRLGDTIGENPQFIIHRVVEGESLPLYADIYQTSVEAIRAVNYSLPRVLWIDQIVIIPLNQTDMAGIPSFIAYEVEAASITFTQIAEEFSVSLADLLKYNNAQEDYLLHQGEWILIPQT